MYNVLAHFSVFLSVNVMWLAASNSFSLNLPEDYNVTKNHKLKKKNSFPLSWVFYHRNRRETKTARYIAHLADCLLSIHEDLGFDYQQHHIKPSMVAHTSDPNTWEVRTGRTGVQDHTQLHRQFKVSLDSIKKNNPKKKELRAGEMTQQGTNLITCVPVPEWTW